MRWFGCDGGGPGGWNALGWVLRRLATGPATDRRRQVPSFTRTNYTAGQEMAPDVIAAIPGPFAHLGTRAVYKNRSGPITGSPSGAC